METASGTLTLVSDWLPSAELRRLVSEYEAEFPELKVAAEGSPEHRGIDPSVAVALVSGAFTLLAPFVTKLAERVFAAEPKASVALDDPSGGNAVVLLSSLPAELRQQLVTEAIASGALRVRINLEQPTR